MTIVSGGRVTGIRLADDTSCRRGGPITTGTFLRGLIHLGEKTGRQARR